jgi:hypothetical protein
MKLWIRRVVLWSDAEVICRYPARSEIRRFDQDPIAVFKEYPILQDFNLGVIGQPDQNLSRR